MSKDMKLIMENWRKYSVITENNIAEQQLHEYLQSLDEISFKGLGARLALMGTLLGVGGPAMAGGIDSYGTQHASELQVDVAGDLIDARIDAQKPEDKEAHKNGVKLAQWVVAQPDNVDRQTFEDSFAKEVGMDKDDALEAYVVLNSAIDYVKDTGAEEVQNKIKKLEEPGAEDSAESGAEDPNDPHWRLKKAQAEYEANPRPVKLMKLNQAREKAGMGPFSTMK